MDVIIRGGTVITAFEAFRADVGITGGKIVDLSCHIGQRASLELDASDKFVLPGLIDSSVSFTPGFDGVTPADGFDFGTRSAAAGGITTIINNLCCPSGRSLLRTIEATVAEVAALSRIDFSFHVCTGPTVRLPEEVFDLVHFGVPSITLDEGRAVGKAGFDGILYSVLQEAGKCGALIGVTPSNKSVTRHLTNTFLAENKCSPDYLCRSWPDFLEKESIARAVVFAEAAGAHLHVYDLSTHAGLSEVENARIRGANVTCETHPYYLLQTMERMFDESQGALYITAPPLRDEKDVTRLWLGLRTGSVQVISSGHRGLWRSQKVEPPAFSDVPPGLGCSEVMLPLLYSEGVTRNLLSLEQLVCLMSHSPACLFGLYPEKGTITVGSDADLVVFNPQRETSLKKETLQGRSDIFPFEGWSIMGEVEMTLLRGQLIYCQGEFPGYPGTGRFVKRVPRE